MEESAAWRCAVAREGLYRGRASGADSHPTFLGLGAEGKAGQGCSGELSRAAGFSQQWWSEQQKAAVPWERSWEKQAALVFPWLGVTSQPWLEQGSGKQALTPCLLEALQQSWAERVLSLRAFGLPELPRFHFFTQGNTSPRLPRAAPA